MGEARELANCSRDDPRRVGGDRPGQFHKRSIAQSRAGIRAVVADPIRRGGNILASLIRSLVLVVSSSSALAEQAQGPQKTGDPFDLSDAREKLGKLGMPTQSVVSDLESKAKALVAA